MNTDEGLAKAYKGFVEDPDEFYRCDAGDQLSATEGFLKSFFRSHYLGSAMQKKDEVGLKGLFTYENWGFQYVVFSANPNVITLTVENMIAFSHNDDRVTSFLKAVSQNFRFLQFAWFKFSGVYFVKVSTQYAVSTEENLLSVIKLLHDYVQKLTVGIVPESNFENKLLKVASNGSADGDMPMYESMWQLSTEPHTIAYHDKAYLGFTTKDIQLNPSEDHRFAYAVSTFTAGNELSEEALSKFKTFATAWNTNLHPTLSVVSIEEDKEKGVSVKLRSSFLYQEPSSDVARISIIGSIEKMIAAFYRESEPDVKPYSSLDRSWSPYINEYVGGDESEDVHPLFYTRWQNLWAKNPYEPFPESSALYLVYMGGVPESLYWDRHNKARLANKEIKDTEEEIREEFAFAKTLDKEEGAPIIKRCAQKGLAEAMAELGRMYINGDGVEQDMAFARNWLTKADAKGNKKAREILDKYFPVTESTDGNQERSYGEVEQTFEEKHPALADAKRIFIVIAIAALLYLFHIIYICKI